MPVRQAKGEDFALVEDYFSGDDNSQGSLSPLLMILKRPKIEEEDVSLLPPLPSSQDMLKSHSAKEVQHIVITQVKPNKSLQALPDTLVSLLYHLHWFKQNGLLPEPRHLAYPRDQAYHNKEDLQLFYTINN